MNASVTEPSDTIRKAWRETHVAPLWEHVTAHKPPAGGAPPHLWRWRTLRPLISETLKITSPAAVERRVLSLINPASRSAEDDSTTRNINAALQILAPGEAARPHRHSMNALRYVLEGSGAATVVDGKECPMAEGDLILTPGWCWHGHVHRGNAPVIWLDVLDVPLHRYLGTTQFEPGPARNLPPTFDDRLFSTPNIVPELPVASPAHSPMFRYPREATLAALQNAPLLADRARRVRFVNPLTGGPAMPLLDSYAVGLDGEVETVAWRTSSSAVCAVMQGQGVSRIGDTQLEWEKNDVFTLPSGNWVTHRAAAGGAVLMVVTDRDVLHRLGLLTEEWA